MRAASVLFVGAGGLGSEVVAGAVQKGLGTALVCDQDLVEPTNLNRCYFFARDLYRNKAESLCRNLSQRGFLGTTLHAYPCRFQDLDHSNLQPDLIVCGVDNQFPETRLAIAGFAHERGIPAVLMGVTTDADGGYVTVQSPGSACWACVMRPDLHSDSPPTSIRCPGTPASIDILKVLAGVALYAMDSLIMRRPRDWNYWSVSLARGGFGGSMSVSPRFECPLCGHAHGLLPEDA
ncbi:MAG: ThiF family adenylyltransferase [Phycisphaerales bacterium]|nr:ThiF family adenylyltransferase [Phycisphaerales bacterium]